LRPYPVAVRTRHHTAGGHHWQRYKPGALSGPGEALSSPSCALPVGAARTPALPLDRAGTRVGRPRNCRRPR